MSHRLVILAGIFNGMILLLLLIVQPVFMVLWLLLTVLVCVILTLRRPRFWQAEIDRVRNGWHRFKVRMGTVQREPEKKIGFTPDHVLVCLKTGQYADQPITKEDFLIGRSPKSDFALHLSPTVSREHCRIIFRKYSQEYYLEDLRSKAGTYMGTRRLEPFTQEKLLDNAEITIGDCRFRFVKRKAG